MISPNSSAAPAFAVVIHEKGGTERRETFESAELTVGRVQGNEIMLPKGNVSKRHARVLYRDGRFIVTDLNSTNGTYVNRRRITQATIVREGDRIYIGDYVLRIELPGADAQLADVSVVTAPRPEFASNSDLSTPGHGYRALGSEDDSSRTPGLARDGGSAGVASSAGGSETPGRGFAPNETTGTHQVLSRNTLDDHVAPEPAQVLRVVATAVEAVVERLGHEVFDSGPDLELAQRSEPLLREAVARVVTARDAPAGLLPDRIFELARAELFELGLLGELLNEPAVTEIGVLRYDDIVAVRGGRSVAVDPGFSCERSLGWAIARLTRQADADSAQLEFRLPSGARVSIDPPSRGKGATLLVRKAERAAPTLDELVRRGVISRAIATFFQHCLATRANLLVVGAHDGAADQVVLALAQAAQDSRLVWVGDGVVGRSEVTIDFGLSSAAEARRALTVSAGVRGLRFVAWLTQPEVTASVSEAVAAGADGLLALRTAPNLRRALLRMGAELSTARPGLGIRAARELIAGSYDVLVEVARLRDERTRVLRIAEVTGNSADEIQVQDIFNFVPDRTAAGGAVEGTFAASGVVPQVVEALRARGENLDSALFSRPPSR